MSDHPASPVANDNVKGLMWMLLSGILMSSMHASIRHVSADLHPFEIAFFRLLFGLLVLAPWFIKLGWAPLRTKRLGLMTLRGVLNIVCMLAFFYALSITPLAEVTALVFTAPIFATILAVFFFGERAGLKRWAAIGFGFFGAMVVLRPGFQDIGLGQWLALFAAIVWGVCMVLIKTLGRTESSLTITVYMSLVMVPLAVLPAALVWQWPTGEQYLWLAAIGFFGGFGQFAMTEALKVGETHVITPMDFTRLIWISVIAYLAFAEVPGLYTWIGGAIIFSATAFIAWRERAVAKAAMLAGIEKGA
ncbi:MAG: DMT family transporter [Alphaproteobacteria bacterium]|nr:DMT family transporter [Alphaproteobacteria bacterium]MBT7943349.1 DMT family transporter [Alphaproteobacteria bacterium]